MPTHGSAAKAARLNKQRRPGDYCKAAGCLWRVRSLRFDNRPCPKHPERDYKETS